MSYLPKQGEYPAGTQLEASFLFCLPHSPAGVTTQTYLVNYKVLYPGEW